MELWIRTQNREALVKTNIIKWENGCLRGFTDEDGWYQSLGIYKKKRALEVLDEIQNKITKFNLKTDYGCTDNIYEMPKE